MRRTLAWLLAGAVAVLAGPVPATAAPTRTGQLVGELRAGSEATVDVRIEGLSQGQSVERLEISLRLHGRVLEELTFDVPQGSVAIVGAGQPVSLARGGRVRGAFLEVDAGRVSMDATGTGVRAIFPLGIRTDPPSGSVLTSSADVIDGPTFAPEPLGPPVASGGSGFSGGSLILFAVVAMLVGMVAGAAVGWRRGPPPRISVYHTLVRRLEEERSADGG